MAVVWRFLYSGLFYLALPVILLRLLWRSRRLPAYRKRWGERLGYVAFPAWKTQPIWIHAVSVGEVVAATPLITALQQQYPEIPLVVTTTTPTGSMQVTSTLAEQVIHSYFCYDLPTVVRRFLHRLQPRLAIMMETELWPNILHQLHQHHIPVMLANARLSQRSLRGYRRFAALTEKMMHQLSLVIAQSEEDGARYKMLGLSSAQLIVSGNTKFDITMSETLATKSEQLRKLLGKQRSIWVVGSTHEGEETQILTAFSIIKVQCPNALLVLVPRHPDRFRAVYTLCQRQGYRVQLRSDQQPCHPETDIFIGDTLGELVAFYGVADVAFVGGSLVEVGGHNLLEPALFATPIITGSHVFNFSQIAAWLIADEAMVVVENSDQLAQAVLSFLCDDARCRTYGQRGQALLASHRGAIGEHLRSIASLVG